MITIDGSFGEGGGQIVRSSVALSLVTGQPVTINHIRAGRAKPGLQRQHVTAVRAAAEISGAQTQGASLGSSRLVFRPGAVQPGSYEFRIGTAGSTTLVLQTILPALMIAAERSTVVLEGGTHNLAAPPFDFLARAYLPLVGRMGPRVDAVLERPGFFPAGGGRLVVDIHPVTRLQSFELVERGRLLRPRVRALVANLPRHIGERECQTIADKTDWDAKCLHVEEVRSARGPGNVLLIELESQHITEVFTGFGRRGVRAETVADETLAVARHYLDSGVPVGPHLADQLLLPAGIAAYQGQGGSRFRTQKLSSHATTHIHVLKQFLADDVLVEQQAPDDFLVRIAATHEA